VQTAPPFASWALRFYGASQTAASGAGHCHMWANTTNGPRTPQSPGRRLRGGLIGSPKPVPKSCGGSNAHIDQCPLNQAGKTATTISATRWYCSPNNDAGISRRAKHDRLEETRAQRAAEPLEDIDTEAFHDRMELWRQRSVTDETAILRVVLQFVPMMGNLTTRLNLTTREIGNFFFSRSMRRFRIRSRQAQSPCISPTLSLVNPCELRAVNTV